MATSGLSFLIEINKKRNTGHAAALTHSHHVHGTLG